MTTGIQCPECSSGILRVLRTVQGDLKVLRQRECKNGHRFITSEEICDNVEFNRIHRERKALRKEHKLHG